MAASEPDFPDSAPAWEKITCLSDINKADHVSINKAPYWHHYIVTDVDVEGQKVTGIGWSISNG